MKRIELMGKRLTRGALRCVIHSRRCDPEEVHPEEIRNILVVRQDNRIGNLILQIPFLKALKQVFPHANITVLLGETFAELYRELPEVQERIIYRHQRLAQRPWEWVSFVRQLGRGGWDLAFECGHPHVVSLNNASLTYLSKARFRVGFRRGDADIFLNMLCEAPERIHYAKCLGSLISDWQKNTNGNPMALPLADVHRDAWKRVWESAGLADDSRVVLIWSGGRYGKRWQVEFWGDIAKGIINHFDDTLLPVVGVGPGERELEQAFKESGIKVARFDGPIEELWSFTDRCQAMISGDSGPMHLAVAMGIPTFALFRVDNVWEYGHDNGKWHRAIYIADNDPVPFVIDFLTALLEEPCPRSMISY